MDDDRMFGVGKPCPVCSTPMEARALPASAAGLSMAHCPNGSMLDHSTQAVAEAAAQSIVAEVVGEMAKALTDPDRSDFIAAFDAELS